MIHLKSTFFLILFKFVYGCITPDGQPGTCILVKDCPRLNNILNNSHRTHAENKFFASSHCGGFANLIKVCCEIEVSGSNYLLPTPNECGESIVSVAEDAPTFDEKEIENPNRYPWMALIEYNTDSNVSVIVCGGTLINNKYILTAAHCVVGPLFTKEYVPTSIRLGDHRIGDYDCNTFKEDCERLTSRYAIEKIIPHPQFDSNDPYFRNDIALLKVSRKISISESVRPICLSKYDVSNTLSAQFILAGWGTGSGISNFNSVKRHKKIDLVEQSKCSELFSRKGGLKIWNKQFCASDDNKSNCIADGGNGLMQIVDNKYYLTGVVSVGSHMCNNSVIPDIYTNVYHYNGWISEQITA